MQSSRESPESSFENKFWEQTKKTTTQLMEEGNDGKDTILIQPKAET